VQVGGRARALLETGSLCLRLSESATRSVQVATIGPPLQLADRQVLNIDLLAQSCS